LIQEKGSPDPTQRITSRRVIWSQGKKPVSREFEIKVKRYPSGMKLESIKQRKSSITQSKSIEILKPTSRGGLRRGTSKALATRTEELEHPAVELRLRMVAFERNESALEKRMKTYVGCFLSKGDEKELLFVEEANEQMSKISPFMWNVTVSLFTTLSSLIKNGNLTLAKRLGTAFLNMEYEVHGSEHEILGMFDDSNHIHLLCECLYF
jgi:hypothetical protein